MSLKSRPTTNDLISVQYYSVFAFQVNDQEFYLQSRLQAVILIQGNSYAILLKSLPIMAYNSLVCFTVQMNYQAYVVLPSRATTKDQASIHVFTAQSNNHESDQHTLLQNPLSPSKVIVKANRSRFTVLQGTISCFVLALSSLWQALKAQLYIKGRRRTKIFKQFTKN
ncbi:hypothetical protein F4703DRAFT_1969551 [Phycomyces blakesleeanus]